MSTRRGGGRALHLLVAVGFATGCEDRIRTLEGPVPLTADEMGAAIDPSTNLVVLYGGHDQELVYGKTWVYQDGSYAEVRTPGPRARLRISMAFDPTRGRAYLFGGRTPSEWVSDELAFFELERQAWFVYEPQGLPGVDRPRARHGAALLYHEAQDRLLLWGGFDEYEQEVDPRVIWSFHPDEGWSRL